MFRGMLLRRGASKVVAMAPVLVLASVTVLLTRSSEPAAAATQGPIASWSFDHEGASQEDLSGNGNTATVEGATWTPHGRYGGAYEFDGEESCVTVADGPQFQLGEELTLEAWVRPAAAGEFSPVFYKQAGETGYGYVLWAGEGEDGVPAGEVNDGTYPEPQIEAKAELTPDVWSHLALTFDGARMRLYVDGELVATGASGAPIASEGPLEIGCGDDFGYEDHFDGRIDEPRVYERALSGAEIVADMEASLGTPEQGPVAEYSFDEDDEETAQDIGGGEHTATLEHTGWTSAGRYGGALEFDGAESCVKVPDSPQLQGGEEFTLEAWVRPAAIEEFLPVFYKQREEDYAYGLWVDEAADGRPAGEINDGSWPIPGLEAKAEIPVHAWSHLALTFDGAHMRLYVDGELEATASSGPPLASEGPLDIGCATVYGFEDHFDGRIDEARVYERALDGAEVAADMETPLQTPKAGPVAAYSFDEGEIGTEGGTVEDVTGNGHTATLEGGAGRVRGRYGDGLQFFGEGDCATVPASPELDVSEEFTLEAWVRPEGGGVYEDPIVVRESEGNAVFGLGIGSREAEKAEGFIGEGKGSRAAIGGEAIRENAWVHLATTYDGARLRLYVDGELVATQDAPTPPAVGEGSLRIGCDGPDGPFGGRIDEVRVYGRALDAAEVDTDMETPLRTPKRTPVAEYSFDEKNEETATDITGDGHTATVEGARWTEHGRYSGAMEFDAAGEDVLKIPASEELDFDEEFTLEAWVRPSGGDNHHAPLIDKQEGAGHGYFLYEGGTVSDRPYGAAAEDQEFVHAEEALPAHAWSHVALTFSGNRTYLYVDGELVANGAAEPTVTEEGELEIGGSTDTGDWFDGRIDEVRIYNRELDRAEIDADMEAPIQTPKQGPIAAWSFDEGEGTMAEDLTGDGHTATIEGAEWARGKYGDALRFDGEGDVVKVPNSPEFDLTEGFTLEAWVRPESASDEWAPILAKEIGGGEGAERLAWWLYEGDGESNVPFGGTEPTPGEQNEAHAEDPLPVDVWSHVALTYDGSQVRLYVDGELVDCSPVPAGPPPVTEGELQIGAATELGDHFIGRIDEVRIYNRPLSQLEIQQTMNSTFPVAISMAAGEVESNDAVMTGIAQVHGEETEYYFEYGPTTSYGSVATGEEIEANGETVEVEEVAVNLAPETTYHYRLVVEGPLGTAYGKDQTFTTGERTMGVEEEEERAAEETPLTEEEGAGLLKTLAKKVPSNFFGMMWNGVLPEMLEADDFEAIEHSGATMFRFAAVRGVEVAVAFNQALSHKLTALPYLGQGAFPKPGTPAATRAINFAEKMVETYGPAVEKYDTGTWEMWNEPNMRFALNPGEPNPTYENSEFQGNVRPGEFAEFYKELVIGVRSVSSGIHILAPGLFGYKSNVNGHLTPRAFLRQFNEALEGKTQGGRAELANPYGSVSLHPYTFKTLTAKEIKKAKEAKRHRGPHAPENEEDAKQVRSEIKGMIIGVQKLEKHMLGERKPIWVTELGFPVRSEDNGKPSKTIPAVTPEEQKLLLRASFAMLAQAPASLKVEHAFYYNIEDLPGPTWEHHAGLLNEKHDPRPAWTAFSNLAGGKACPHSSPC